MKYGNIKYNAIEDGIGCRTVLFVSGCRHHCEGCFQEQTWNFDYGNVFDNTTAEKIIASLKPSYINGLTLLGGEPFEPENQKPLLDFTNKVKHECPGKTIWAYTGCLFEELIGTCSIYHTENTMALLHNIDTLVDGPFIADKRNLSLAFRGSENQRIINVAKSIETSKIVIADYT